MFKFKVREKDDAVNRIKKRFNNKPFLYRARVFLKTDLIAWYMSKLKQNK